MSEHVRTAGRGSGWTFAAGAVVVGAAVARIHNAFAFPPLRDFDGPAHALSVFALYEGRLPDPASWAGFHPPAFYALGAALWHVLPESVPVHAGLRLLSGAAGFGALAIAWRTLRRFAPAADAAAIAALAAGAPVFALATSMLGNETLCTLLATAALARLCAIPAEPARIPRHAAGTALLAGLAALAKITGAGVAAAAALAYGWHLRRDRPRAARALLVSLALPALLVAPHAIRLVAARGTPLAVVSGGAPADALGSEMAAQPPGERHLVDYLLVPPGTFLAPFKEAPGMVRSVPGMLYASTWADAHGQFLPVEERAVIGAAALGSLLGLVPTALAALGLVRVVRRRDPRFAAAGGALAFAALLALAFAVQVWVVPRYSAVKASYLLPALLPACLLLAAGLASRRPRTRAVLRGLLVATGAFGCALTWYGWWS